MLKINGCVVVEGKYDKIKLSRIIDCPIITTDGFSVFKNPEKRALIRYFAKNGGITILTDSDSAGFKIRGYIKGFVKNGEVRNVYIPDVFGKEPRKRAPSAEGKLGVEGISDTLIISAFERAGVIGKSDIPTEKVSRADLYEDGLFGGKDSSEKRRRILSSLGLPENLSVSGLLDVINASLGKEGYKKLLGTDNPNPPPEGGTAEI